ncbi:MerC domain-containing protein [Fulvivirga maritima]|uniref:MerC domain-containing protein n=1 Tax=Fulvivirga maritima TaxID=2904247 RepID=UPI001F38D9E5|nr:MerC domain-containing protein [Fulvivirga maritima]UII25187.1 MerC domain-containing protein [Fulvivirga maritima]
MKNSFVGVHWDFLGFSASFLCVIHCLALPIILSLSPWVGWQVMHDPGIELTILVVSLVIAAFALFHGYRNHHGNFKPIIIAFAGFLFILVGHAFFHDHEVFITAPGAILVAIAHVLNWYYERNEVKPTHSSKQNKLHNK